MVGSVHFSFPLGVLVLGIIEGSTYGLLAVGIVLIYRSSRIVNFAYGQTGALVAALFTIAVLEWRIPYYVALGPLLILGALIGMGTEVIAVRRLRNTPPVIPIVATVGLATFMQGLVPALNANLSNTGTFFPQPPWFPTFAIGPLLVDRSYSAMLIVMPVIVLALAWFLQRSRSGVSIRAAAANSEAAQLSGVLTSRVSLMAWGIGGAISAFVAIMTSAQSTSSPGSSPDFGPALLLTALTAAVIARMTSIPIAMIAGIGVGIAEQLLIWNTSNPELVTGALFLTLAVALLVQPRAAGGRQAEKNHWLAVTPWGPLPEALRTVWLARNLKFVLVAIGAVLIVGLESTYSSSTAVTLTVMLSFATIGLSVGMLTGLAGQISLGQWGVAGIGGAAVWLVLSHGGNYVLALAAAAAAGAAVSVLLGIPATRVRGVMLAVVTLAFGQAVPWLLDRGWLLAQPQSTFQPRPFGLNLSTSKRYLDFALFMLLLALGFAYNVWNGGLARRYRAVRDNEDGARSFTINARRAKLGIFALSGCVAGIGGAVYANALGTIDSTTFSLATNVAIVAMAALGGIAALIGPLLGVLYIVGVPKFLPLDSAGIAASSLGWLLVVIYLPGGFAQGLIAPLRRQWHAALARLYGLTLDGREGAEGDKVSLPIAEMAAVGVRDEGLNGDSGTRSSFPMATPGPERGRDEVVLKAEHLTKRFGGIRAVSDVSFEVRAGETMGFIGPNGAGKTTLFELISGFTKSDSGRVTFASHGDISRLGPEARGRLGLIRSFQDAALFQSMTVLDTLQVALERTSPTRMVPSLAGVDRGERRRRSRALEIISFMGLDRYRNTLIAELSTGTRRITELACMVALEPNVLLLDEPTSGVAQSETEALGDLLLSIKKHLRTTLLVVEHDIALIMRISDRILAMAAGEVIAVGAPDVIRRRSPGHRVVPWS